MSAPSSPVKLTGRSALVALVGVVVLVAWLLAFFLPESHKLHSLDAERTSLQSNVVADQARLHHVKEEAQHVTEIKAMYERLEGYAPSTERLYTYIHTISAAAKSAGVKITSLNAGGITAVTGSPYSALPISAAVNGTYDQLLAFLKGLYALPRLTDVNSVSVSGGGPRSNQASRLSVSLQLAIFTSQKSTGSGT